MPSAWRTILIAAVAAFVAGGLGVYTGMKLAPWNSERSALDGAIHHDLHLTPQQNAAIEDMEGRFHARKLALENEMRAATRDIAAAVSEDGGYTPRVQRSVERFHAADSQLQRETIEHVFEMRSVLSPSQQQKFDEIIRAEFMKAAEVD